jgi:chromosomal replication initiation ATPase DnaA
MIGVLVSVIAQAKLENATPTMNSVTRMLQKLYKAKEVIGRAETGAMVSGVTSVQQQAARTLDDVINTVAGYYKIDRTILTGNERRREVIIPRQICMYLIRELLNQSYETIGENFGGKNHTTVLHSCNKIMAQIREDQRLMRDVNALKREMGF